MSLYEQILNLPLFQGLSKSDLDDIVAHIKFDFSKAEPGEAFILENAPCTHLKFLLNGTAIVHRHADDNSYSIDEYVSAPAVFQLDRLFGLSQFYSMDVVAQSTCSILTITKEDIMLMCDKLLIFRINMFNRIATDAQRNGARPWKSKPKSIESKLIRFIDNRSIYPAGRKTINTTMKVIANEINESRINVSRVLNKLNDEGLISISRGRIDIPSLESLLQLKDSH